MQRLSVFIGGLVLLGTLAPMAFAQGPRWVETHSWTGGGTRQTQLFQVYGERWEIRHLHTGEGVLTIDLYDGKGNRLGKPVALATPGPGAASIEGRGARYLVIAGPGDYWDVRIAQYLTPTEEASLSQVLGKALPPLKRKAIWTGTGGTQEYFFTVKTAPWVVRWANLGYGRVTVSVRDKETWTPQLFASSEKTGVAESWGHRPGTFTVRVDAVPTEWKVAVFGE